MMTEAASAWNFEVEQGPEWLTVRVSGPDSGDAAGTHVADTIWQLVLQHSVMQVVLDLSGLRILRSVVLGQLVQLHKRIYTHGGLLRLAGLSDDNNNVLVACRLHTRFARFATVEEAVKGHHALQPQ